MSTQLTRVTIEGRYIISFFFEDFNIWISNFVCFKLLKPFLFRYGGLGFVVHELPCVGGDIPDQFLSLFFSHGREGPC